ncbi:MAG: hypothetical protein P8X43_08180 [Maritimibacter sp.]
MKMTVFLMLRAAPSWLQLARNTRNDIAEKALGAAFPDAQCSLRFFDAEAFHARVSDVAMIEAESVKDYYFAIERLRDSPLIAEGYFELVEVIPAYEDGFRQFEAAL